LASLSSVSSRPATANETVAASKHRGIANWYNAQFQALQNFNSDRIQNGLGKNRWTHRRHRLVSGECGRPGTAMSREAPVMPHPLRGEN
jgi:hypothetical protein